MSPRRLCVDRIHFEAQENGPDILVAEGPTTEPQPCFFSRNSEEKSNRCPYREGTLI